MAVAAQLSDPMGAELLRVARGAFTSAMAWASIVSGALALTTALAAVLLLRQVGADAGSDRHAQTNDDPGDVHRRCQPIASEPMG
jgi:hypothetical protein